MQNLNAGLIPLCLLILSGCASIPSSPAVTLTVNGCPSLTPCRFPAASPQTNGELNNQLDETEAALADCADQVDITIACQERAHAETALPTKRID
ncbi:Rz1-like lysis system protein LysC [Pectobacteriaceae bacterium CE90]|nr:Rz1-like lysis system protein LysC [Prodigiosinella sp. LS101]WJV54474.1 Rz1-like lysis system protein LysC [Prodigiosinella sp. LS101]WJV58836.1 Rz1-like lysis system protein LysC [Pectobacteriaceae bacterium C111]WJY14488.1 Rz1-like lysis system protein LysC [Pectobacteriaceae bacterium CE90]WJY16024.1 Rz1-like lysis system protein LysC [Pectobacteriaceae bacterium CE90]